MDDAGGFGPVVRPVEERLWAKIDRRGDDECWLWLGARDPHGYGQLAIGSTRDGTARKARVTKLVYEIVNGPLPLGKPHVLHSCDNPPCCNPKHLHPGTHAENMAEAIERRRVARDEANGRYRSA